MQMRAGYLKIFVPTGVLVNQVYRCYVCIRYAQSLIQVPPTPPETVQAPGESPRADMKLTPRNLLWEYSAVPPALS